MINENNNKIPCGGFYLGDGLTMDGNTLKSLGGEQVQSDYTQNDPTAKDYIKNRPGGYMSNPHQEYLLNATEYAFSNIVENVGVETLPEIIPISGNTEYIVEWDGISYRLTAKNVEGLDGAAFVGNAALVQGGADTKEPFCIVTFKDRVTQIAAAVATEHTVAISTSVSSVIPIDNKFLSQEVFDYNALNNKPVILEPLNIAINKQKSSITISVGNNYIGGVNEALEVVDGVFYRISGTISLTYLDNLTTAELTLNGLYPSKKDVGQYIELNEVGKYPGDAQFERKPWSFTVYKLFSTNSSSYPGALGISCNTGKTSALFDIEINLTIEKMIMQIDEDCIPDSIARKDKVYTKDEVYNKGQVYSKNETYPKGQLYTKDNLYTKSETYAKSEVYPKTQVYSKDEVNEQLGKKADISLSIAGVEVGNIARVDSVDENGNPTKWGVVNANHGMIIPSEDKVWMIRIDHTGNVSGIDITSNYTDATETITDSWEEIIAACADGTYSTKYSVGDTKLLNLGSEGIVAMQIAAFDADDLVDGSGKAPISWISEQLLKTDHRMNPERVKNSDGTYQEGTGSIGGWEKSEMRSYLIDTIKPLIPSSVSNAIKPVTKTQYAYNTSGSYVAQTTTDDVWIPSDSEIFGSSSSLYYPLFQDIAANRKKKKLDSTSASSWWIRSANDVNGFGGVNSDGSVVGYYSNKSYSVALGFCT